MKTISYIAAASLALSVAGLAGSAQACACKTHVRHVAHVRHVTPVRYTSVRYVSAPRVVVREPVYVRRVYYPAAYDGYWSSYRYPDYGYRSYYRSYAYERPVVVRYWDTPYWRRHHHWRGHAWDRGWHRGWDHGRGHWRDWD
jgi:hypothetical protein